MGAIYIYVQMLWPWYYIICVHTNTCYVSLSVHMTYTHMINNASPQILYPEAWNPDARKKQTLVLALCIPEPISTSNPTGPIAALLDRSVS